jgi:hypothetical protein
MQYQQLGSTGVFVSKLCFGAMTFGGKGTVFEVIGGLSQKDSDSLIGQTSTLESISSIQPTSTARAIRRLNWRRRWAIGGRT